ncbi:unnamed protein product [Amoebophrya sp. A25]|nr:unnamed protein product [Amoebophrya sp. A25]|eukprot:GSA25T00021778001.1
MFSRWPRMFVLMRLLAWGLLGASCSTIQSSAVVHSVVENWDHWLWFAREDVAELGLYSKLLTFYPAHFQRINRTALSGSGRDELRARLRGFRNATDARIERRKVLLEKGKKLWSSSSTSNRNSFSSSSSTSFLTSTQHLQDRIRQFPVLGYGIFDASRTRHGQPFFSRDWDMSTLREQHDPTWRSVLRMCDFISSSLSGDHDSTTTTTSTTSTRKGSPGILTILTPELIMRIIREPHAKGDAESTENRPDWQSVAEKRSEKMRSLNYNSLFQKLLGAELRDHEQEELGGVVDVFQVNITSLMKMKSRSPDHLRRQPHFVPLLIHIGWAAVGDALASARKGTDDEKRRLLAFAEVLASWTRQARDVLARDCLWNFFLDRSQLAHFLLLAGADVVDEGSSSAKTSRQGDAALWRMLQNLTFYIYPDDIAFRGWDYLSASTRGFWTAGVYLTRFFANALPDRAPTSSHKMLGVETTKNPEDADYFVIPDYALETEQTVKKRITLSLPSRLAAAQRQTTATGYDLLRDLFTDNGYSTADFVEHYWVPLLAGSGHGEDGESVNTSTAPAKVARYDQHLLVPFNSLENTTEAGKNSKLVPHPQSDSLYSLLYQALHTAADFLVNVASRVTALQVERNVTQTKWWRRRGGRDHIYVFSSSGWADFHTSNLHRGTTEDGKNPDIRIDGRRGRGSSTATGTGTSEEDTKLHRGKGTGTEEDTKKPKDPNRIVDNAVVLTVEGRPIEASAEWERCAESLARKYADGTGGVSAETGTTTSASNLSTSSAVDERKRSDRPISTTTAPLTLFDSESAFNASFLYLHHCALGDCFDPANVRHMTVPSVVDQGKATKLIRHQQQRDAWENRTHLLCFHGRASRFGSFIPGDFTNNAYTAVNETVRLNLHYDLMAWANENKATRTRTANESAAVLVTSTITTPTSSPTSIKNSLLTAKKTKGVGNINGIHVGDSFDGHVYSKVITDCKYCLAPKGLTSYTSRLYESFFAGCIPVLLSDDLEAPFDYDSTATSPIMTPPQQETSHRGIDWRKAALWLPQDTPPRKLLAFLTQHRLLGDRVDAEKETAQQTLREALDMEDDIVRLEDAVRDHNTSVNEDIPRRGSSFDENFPRARTGIKAEDGKPSTKSSSSTSASRNALKWSTQQPRFYSFRKMLMYGAAAACWMDYVGALGVPAHDCSPYKAVVSRLRAIRIAESNTTWADADPQI